MLKRTTMRTSKATTSTVIYLQPISRSYMPSMLPPSLISMITYRPCLLIRSELLQLLGLDFSEDAISAEELTIAINAINQRPLLMKNKPLVTSPVGN